MTVYITVPGVALTERKRQRFIPGKGRVGARTDEPDRVDFKARLAFFATQQCRAPLAGPLAVSITIRKPKPPSWPQKPCKTNPWPWAWWKKPDCSNFDKIVEDALTGIAWHDDAQIIDLHVHKEFANRDEVIITVAEAQECYVPGNGSALSERVRVPQDPKTGLAAIIGQWPGDETDEEVQQALDELS